MNALEVKSIRKNLGLTQANFAKKLGVNVRTVQNWEAGGVIPDSKSALLRNLQTESLQQSSPQKNGEEASVSESKYVTPELVEQLINEIRNQQAQLVAANNALSMTVQSQNKKISELEQQIKKDNAQLDDNAICADAG